MEERVGRRSTTGRGQRQPRPLLPLATPNRTRNDKHSTATTTISCCYCDCKISALNGPLFRFGRKHAKWLRPWFSVGVGFALTALLGATMILVWELGIALRVFRWNPGVSGSLLFGLSPEVYGLRVSLADAGYLLFSTVVSVSVHEFGHAIAAASEGIQMEYIAVFVAVLFPGALVAFSWEMLQALENFAALRVYCAGIWHNAVCCAACGIALFLMPLFLCPFYVYGENPMVLDVPSTSPLSGYLSPGDVILALNGYRIQNEREWIMKTALMDKQTRQTSNDSAYSEELAVVYGRNSYCVPTSTIEEIQKIHLAENPSACPSDLTEFVSVQCNDISKLKDGSIDDDPPKIWVNSHCLNAKEVVKLSKCFDEIGTEMTNGSSCLCSQVHLFSISCIIICSRVISFI
ncbi:hypothetical protein Tsubulata_002859 [Turnera subulata]|uniref:Endopeptidase S2P n=1 Tax=Turnera subulata TaxID=218843 RepID=A0A9Q0FBK5_9ROSI|nr:hypothetical protein Tsubulata_002859 [Turnera subulata]